MNAKRWYVEGHNIRCEPTAEDSGTYIAVMESSRSPQETAENARLIAKAPEMREAMADLFEHCAMVHKHWGDGSNAKQADAAIKRASALLEEREG